MFNFLSMAGNYEQRKVAHTDLGDGAWVDTAAVNDAAQPYETAVQHPRYNDGKMVIVEMYESKTDANAGHERWVATMTADELPASLKDVGTSEVSLFIDALSDKKWREKDVTPSTSQS